MKTKLDIEKIQNFLNKFNKKFGNNWKLDEEATKNNIAVFDTKTKTYNLKELNYFCTEFEDSNPSMEDYTLWIYVYNNEYRNPD